MLLSPPDGCGLFHGCHKRIRPRATLRFPVGSCAKMSSLQFYSGTLRDAQTIYVGWCEIGQVSLGRWAGFEGCSSAIPELLEPHGCFGAASK
jgi:hypothetical protein